MHAGSVAARRFWLAFTSRTRRRVPHRVLMAFGRGPRNVLLTASFLDGAVMAPNGRSSCLRAKTQGAGGERSSPVFVDISVPETSSLCAPKGGSDPSWSPAFKK